MDGGGIGGRGCLDWEIILIGGMYPRWGNVWDGNIWGEWRELQDRGE